MVDCQWEFSHKVPGTSGGQRAEGEKEGKRGHTLT